MNFLIDLFKKAFKGNNFRISDDPIKYNNKMTQLSMSQKGGASSTRKTKLILNLIQSYQEH